MRALVSRVLISGALAALSAGVAFPQDKNLSQDKTLAAAAGDKYVISATAGGVNFVEGAVSVARKAGTSGILIKGDTLEIGDRVSTSADGKAEILLNPGSFLRLGSDSTFEFATTNLDDLRINLSGGSAIFEVFADDEFRVSVATPKSNFYLIRSGIYRVDVETDGTGSIEVWKGKAQVGDSEKNVVKSGREANLENGTLAIAKFDREEKDEFELWSKGRAKELAKAVSRLQRKTLRTSLMHSFLGRSWNMYDSFGGWVFDPFGRSYCFLPFGYGWSSPYGYGFSGHIGGYNLPPVVYAPPRNGINTSTGGTQTTGGAATAPSGRRRQAPMPSETSGSDARSSGVPAFVRMQGGGTTGGSGPVYDPDSGAKGRSRQIDSPATIAPSRGSASPRSAPSSGGDVAPTRSRKGQP